MKTRWISLGVAIGLGLAIVVGFGLSSGMASPAQGAAGWAGMGTGTTWAAMDAMHDSAAMLQLHAQMPADLQAQCDAIHEQMQQTTNGGFGGMMGAAASGIMGGFSSSHAAHHPDGPIPGGMGGMTRIGSSSGMMGG